MKAISLIPGTTTIRLVDRPEPVISGPRHIKLKVLRTGICGTDREEAAGGRALAPSGQPDLVIGHEMFGRVVGIGSAVTRVKPGDLAVLTVRRGCGKCGPCLMNRSDMCSTGQFQERGIWGRDGYHTEYVVDREQYAVPVPAELESIGVLTEPTSVVEKAIDEAVLQQLARLPDAAATPHWLSHRKCLVAGLGPIGLLGAMILILRGAEVYGLDVVDEESIRPKWLTTIGGRYIDGRKVSSEKLDKFIGPMDLILEAAGIASLDFNLLDVLAINGVFVLTGIPGGDRPLQIAGSTLMRNLVLGNRVISGSVNAAPGHYQMAIDDLQTARTRWGDHVNRLITHRYSADDFASVLGKHPVDEIKAVLEWGNGKPSVGGGS